MECLEDELGTDESLDEASEPDEEDEEPDELELPDEPEEPDESDESEEEEPDLDDFLEATFLTERLSRSFFGCSDEPLASLFLFLSGFTSDL